MDGRMAKMVLRCYCLIGWLIIFQPSTLYGQDSGQDTNTQPAAVSRTWRDSTRVFVIEAKLVELSNDKAKLRKADGSEVEVRRDAFSKEDQQYLEELDKTRNPFAANPSTTATKSPARMPARTGEPTVPQPNPSKTLNFSAPDLPPILPSSQNVVVYTPTTKLESLKTKPIEPLTIPPGEVYIANAEISARISPILVVEAASRKVAISVGPPAYASRRSIKSQVLIGELPRGPFECLIEQEDPISLLDHNITTGQTLAATGIAGEDSDRDLVLMEGLADGHPVEVARFRLPTELNTRRAINQAKLVGPSIALVVADRTAYCWDLSTGKLVYQSEPRRIFVNSIAISSDLSLMAVPSDIGIHFASPLTGKDLGFLPCKGMTNLQIAFDSRSQSIGYVSGNYWGVYDYEKRTQSEPMMASSSLAGQICGWIKPNLLVVGNGIVLDTERQVPVWKYAASNWPTAKIWNDTVTLIENIQGIRLRTMPMPHPECLAALEKLQSMDDLFAMDVGKPVQLQYELPDPLPKEVDRNELENRMQLIVKRAGWVLDEKAALKLVVKIAPGAKRKENYQKAEQLETVEIVPMVSRLELRAEDGSAIWWTEAETSRGAAYGSPKLSKEEFIRERQQAFPAFFYNLVLPTRIPRQPFTYGLGQSYDHSGLWETVPIQVR